MGDALLTKRFGKETINFFAGSTLNRFSFKRQDQKFLKECFDEKSARFLAFKELDPLADQQGKLVLLERKDVADIVQDAYALSDEEKVKTWSAEDDTVTLVFLGCDESRPTSVGGEPYFAIDVTPLPRQRESEKKAFIDKVTSQGHDFKNVRVGVRMEQHEAAMVALGRSMIDWNNRYGYCSGCGGRTMSVWAGYKRQCPDKDRVSGERQPCVSRKGLHNYAYPRTDTTVIMGILSEDGKKILLGRQKSWPPGMYSCLAGFMEPGESLEEAVRREVWEESGVKVGRVQYHSSQPWPFPSTLMVGCIGQVVSSEGEKIDLGNDPELENARWFSREELSKAGTMGKESKPGQDQPEYSTPPEMAIAKQLINCFVRDDWSL
ncbi:NADH pyrophosphatase [Savitreella phatthalungensis]